MILIDADALLKKTINNPLHVPYITKKDVIDMPSALNNQVNLCDSCTYTYPECPSEKDDVIFGNGIGNDNICACNKYQPTVQPVVTDTNVGDKIYRQAAIDAADRADYTGLAVEDVKKVTDEVVKELKRLPSAQPEQRWIPCSERLPEEPGEYHVTNHLGHVVRYVFNDTASSKEYWRRCAIAWMPLLEPYKEGET